jgi:hypothetical protein
VGGRGWIVLSGGDGGVVVAFVAWDPVVGLAGVAQAGALVEDPELLEPLEGRVDGAAGQVGLLDRKSAV